MKLCCYWKEEKLDLEGIATKIYQLCKSVHSVNPDYFNSWLISFKNQWAFSTPTTSLNEFVQRISQGVWQEDKTYLKRKGFNLSPKIRDEAGFGISLSCIIGSKQSIHFRCLMGVYDETSINSCVVTFPKTFRIETELLKSVVVSLSPQWSTFTEEKLYEGIAEFSKDLVPGYWMFFSDSAKLPLSGILNNFITKNEKEGIYLQISSSHSFSDSARKNAELLSKCLKENNIDFWTLLI